MSAPVLTTSKHEFERAVLLRKVHEKKLTQRKAAKLLQLSVRQVERLCQRYRTAGPAALASRRCGRTSNPRALALKERPGFGIEHRREPSATNRITLGSVSDILPEELPAGFQFGGYHIQSCIGRGRMAREAGVVHRDLKPSNIFLSSGADGVMIPKVLDFGVSKFASEAQGAMRGPTRTREGIGTPAYM